MRRAAIAASALALLAALAGCAVDGQNGAVPGSEPGSGPVGVVPGSGEESDARRRARIRVELAAGYYQQRNLQVALDELGQALRADPEYPAAYGMLGLVYMDLGDRARADESFQRGLRLAPNDAELNNNYGWFLCNTGREREALGHFEQALRDPLYRTPTVPLHNAGICSLRLGEQMAAESYFQRAFQVDASNPVAMFNLGQIFLKRGELERARFHAQRLVTMFEPSAQTLWLALKVERGLGNRDAEASLGSQLRRRFPESAEARLLAAGRYSD
ncbi:type IV pilus biogenesis/stability protein PilW [Zeimonas arvi]|uniref:Type IV pilus biogenesis/stability protein PilW n=1 Tax=Zeimonas arvi TaxID=2498847 RepID=A0A5C8NKJ4_9BURK|nr:type IV pilus biogenesis/stability protein PilW [Zeimonas arvi]TXL61660.1 type IV pilus biogenesis/stability protein PilW [Zeimonas arvi]